MSIITQTELHLRELWLAPWYECGFIIWRQSSYVWKYSMAWGGLPGISRVSRDFAWRFWNWIGQSGERTGGLLPKADPQVGNLMNSKPLWASEAVDLDGWLIIFQPGILGWVRWSWPFRPHVECDRILVLLLLGEWWQSSRQIHSGQTIRLIFSVTRVSEHPLRHLLSSTDTS